MPNFGKFRGNLISRILAKTAKSAKISSFKVLSLEQLWNMQCYDIDLILVFQIFFLSPPSSPLQLDKVYNESDPNVDRQERDEEMERMREHVLKTVSP